MLRGLALASALLAGCASPGLPSLRANGPFLYRIAGESPSYLFGTIHVPDERVLELSPPVARALAGSSALYTELRVDPELKSQVVAEVSATGQRLPPLRERLPDDLYARLEAYLELRGLTAHAFDQRRVWTVAMGLPLLDYLERIQTLPVLDEYLALRAREWGIPLDSLETMAEQVGPFQALDPGDEVRLLDATLTQLERDQAEGRSAIEELVLAYLAGDERALLVAVLGGQDPNDPENAQLMDQLLNARSRIMAQRIAAILAEDPGRPRFFAVGAGHLPGDEGIVALLRARGLDVRRVRR